MNKIIRSCLIILCAAAAISLCGCIGMGGGAKKIGIFMPSKNETRWLQDSDSLMRQLQAKDYHVETRNAEDDVELQISQIEAMIDDNYDILVIAAIDGSRLKDTLQRAADKNIRVISYDRLIMDSPNVDYYVTFDNFEVGVLQGEYIRDALGLEANEGPFNIELFAGAPTDNNAVFFYDGALSVLGKYLDSGRLRVVSGERERTDVAIAEWRPELARERMGGLLEKHYGDGTKLHAVLSPNDGLAAGIIGALKDGGYGGDGKPFPILTGQDSDIPNIRAIIAGEQSMTVFKDTRTLADRTFRMIDDLLIKNTTETNDSRTYHNNIKIVPSYICKPVLVTADNYKRVLVDSGYYEISEIEG